jgi:hypothetical protein
MDRILRMVLAYCVMIIVGVVATYIFMTWNDSWTKAQQFDIYKDAINQFEKCYPYTPVVICSTGINSNSVVNK